MDWFFMVAAGVVYGCPKIPFACGLFCFGLFDDDAAFGWYLWIDWASGRVFAVFWYACLHARADFLQRDYDVIFIAGTLLAAHKADCFFCGKLVDLYDVVDFMPVDYGDLKVWKNYEWFR